MPRLTLAEYQAWLARQYSHVAGRVEPKHEAGEYDLHNKILAECRRRGWIALHGRMDCETGRTIGEPDFTVLADGGRVYFVECKSATGKLSPKQAALHAWAEKLGHHVAVIRSLQQFLELVREPQSKDPTHDNWLEYIKKYPNNT